MRKRLRLPGWLAFARLASAFFLVLLLGPACCAMAQDIGEDGKRKKPVTESRKTAEQGQDGLDEGETIPEKLLKMLYWNAFVELNYAYADVSDVENKDRGSSSDFFIGTAGLGLDVFFYNENSVRIAVEAEDVGRRGGNGNLTVDEATLSLRPLQPPLYLVLGKRQLPFGVFENRLIDGPLTEDLYEINEWGGTFGLILDFWRLNVSYSMYKDATIIRNLEDFQTYESSHDRNHENDFHSYIANVTWVPLAETLYLAAFYDDEPGHGTRNRSIGGALTVVAWDLKLDLEYIAALSRQKDEDEQEAKESALVIGLAYDLLDTVELAVRYETFHDDRAGDQDEVINYRVLGGMNLSFWEFATLSFQYSFSRYEKEKGSDASDAENLFQVQLSLEI